MVNKNTYFDPQAHEAQKIYREKYFRKVHGYLFGILLLATILTGFFHNVVLMLLPIAAYVVLRILVKRWYFKDLDLVNKEQLVKMLDLAGHNQKFKNTVDAICIINNEFPNKIDIAHLYSALESELFSASQNNAISNGFVEKLETENKNSKLMAYLESVFKS
ncbi:hypothetical protein MOW14_14765 (plasmid) [Acinetobacter indicus]|uniref:hypothetical protein n=1 Tax=Acinetobacter indicus TaxID=756892 RepID=UPI001FA6DE6F|nr:hypothetical protein [Acinetobacter indicus]UNW11163.1 hypothetical protein MOW14_14765 [Acinetobacter indicus]